MAQTTFNGNGDRIITDDDKRETRVYEETILGRGPCKTIIDNTTGKVYEAEWHPLRGDYRGDER